MDRLQLIRKSLDEKIRQYEASKSQLVDTRSELINLEDELIDVEEAHQLITGTAQEIQQRVHHRISSVVSRCLESVFDDPYQFQILFEQKAGRTEAKIQFVRCEMGVDPLSASGGGVVDVAAFALRLACLSLRRPPLRRLLVFDEPFRFLSAEYRPRIRALLETLSKEFGVQFVIVTHIEELRCGKVIEIGGEDK